MTKRSNPTRSVPHPPVDHGGGGVDGMRSRSDSACRQPLEMLRELLVGSP